MKDNDRVKEWVRKNSDHVRIVKLGAEPRKTDGPIKVIRI
jgi:hypothetical protein